MPGKILKVSVQPGSTVKSGELLLVLEAMKMENEVLSPASGTVKEVRVKAGDSVNTGDTLVIIA
jgi:glutaconyl-CoA decarboxylase